MKRIVVAAAALNQIPLDWEGNAERIRLAIAKARSQQAQILCLPELAITGYGCEDHFLAPEVGEQSLLSLKALAEDTKGMVVAIGLPLWHDRSVFNAVALLVDGEVSGFVAKQNLAGDGLHYETRWFKPWSAGAIEHTFLEPLGASYPVGDLVFEVGGVRLGFEICEDAWVAERPGVRLARRGVDLILNPSASHFAFGKQEIRERFVLEGSRAFACGYIYANLLGNEAGRAIYDGSTSIAVCGDYLAEGDRFSFQDVELTAAAIDIQLARLQQAKQVSFRPDLSGEDDGVVKIDYALTAAPLSYKTEKPGTYEEGCRFEEFSRVIALALFDYLRKSYSGGFVVSLSGGADSAAVAVLVRLMVDLGCECLGVEGFKKKLSHISWDERPLTNQLLDCVYQATTNSSETTRHAAETVAHALQAGYQEWNVDALVKGYQSMVEQTFGRTLDWQQDDIPLQNIQARTRAPGVWLLTNLRNALLLSTSNRSEAAVGYATMDGDTCGGLSPVSGIDKAFLRNWLVWMEKEGVWPDIKPIPQLSVINEQAPTAELRPQEDKQTDESDLMPYPVLEAIEKLAIRDKKLPREVLAYLQHAPESEGATFDTLKGWVIRFFQLWSRNQWKRERYAPGFHVDDKNLDPKTWCRFPILSSGFRQELEELKALSESDL